MGTTGPGVDRSGDRRALRPEFPDGHHRRHGARPGDAARRAGHREAALRDRRLDGRHAGAAMGGELSRARLSRPSASPPRARHSAQNIAFHEVGRQAIMADPDWRGGDYRAPGVRPRKGLAVARMAAHITYLSEAALQRKFGRELQRDGAVLGLRRRLPGRELSAPPGRDASSTASTPTPISTSPARWTISTSPPTTAACWPKRSAARKTRFCVISFTSDWLYPDGREPRDRAGAERRRRARSASSRSRPTRATTPSCSTSRRCSRPLRGFLDAAAPGAGR